MPIDGDKTEFRMTAESIDAFITAEAERGISPQSCRRTRGYLDTLRRHLGDDGRPTTDALVQWRLSLVDRGCSPVTISNYSKAINRYLRYHGLDDRCYKRGNSYDLRGRVFGYLTVEQRAEHRSRTENCWICRCRCGAVVEVGTSSLISGNTRSCGCLMAERLRDSNRYYAGTQLSAFDGADGTNASRRGSASGYRNIYRSGDKWLVKIVYRGVAHTYGRYGRLEDAVRARDNAMEDIVADALRLQREYDDLHRQDEPALPTIAATRRT